MHAQVVRAVCAQATNKETNYLPWASPGTFFGEVVRPCASVRVFRRRAAGWAARLDGVAAGCVPTQALASELFHDPQALLVIQGGEFASRTSAARLLGAAPGYIGFGAGGLLTEALRRRPHCVVLLQQADKAHPEVGCAWQAGGLAGGRGGGRAGARQSCFIMPLAHASDLDVLACCTCPP
jgi:hypothetical protein